MNTTIVIIPALNEQDTVADVVASVKSHLGCDVLVIDDGSTDATRENAHRAGASVLSHPINLGVGTAIRSALSFAKRHGYSRALQLDADGQHPAESGKALLDAIDDGFDLAIGSRFEHEYKVGFLRRTAMRRLARKASKSVGSTITDATSGFRAFGVNAIDVLAPQYPSAYLSDTVETLLIAGDEKLKVTEVAVPMNERLGGERSAGIMKSIGYLLRLYLVIYMHPLRKRRK